jgi:type I restriction enzyme S subunit
MVGQNEFKDTEIGKIPTQWGVGRLAEFVGINKKSVDPSKDSPNGKFLYIDIDAVENGTGVIRNVREIIGKDAPSRARREIHYNDVLMSTVRPYLKAFTIVPKEFHNQICSTGFAVLTCRDRIIPLYLFHTLFTKSVMDQCRKMMVGGQYPALSGSHVENLRIPLPPLPEQKKIAEILSTADQAIEKVDEAIDKTQKLKKGLMQDLLTKGIGHREFKETKMGRIPKEWEVKKLGEVIALCQYGLSSKMSQAGEYPIIKMDDIVNGNVVPDKVKYINLDKKKFENFRLEKGDILFNRTNSYELVGRTGIFLLDGEYVFASYLIRLRPKGEVADSFFLTSYLIFSNEKLRRLATRAVHQANINATTLQRVMVLIPPLPEQQKIAEILSTVDERLELLRKRKGRLKRTKKGLMNDLLTGNKRVRLEA